MFHAKNYVLAESLEEAWQLNQKRTNKILGGMAWMKMGKQNYQTVIDLSALHLNQIEEKEESFLIGCMVSLHDLETDKRLETYFHGAIQESTRHIVGIQFRNCATVGGSIFGRYGFSDILTCFMALDAQVELYKGGIMPIHQFASMPYDNDILVRIILPKKEKRVVYQSMRNTATDFPVLTVAVSFEEQNGWLISVGARPGKAVCLSNTELTSNVLNDEEMEKLVAFVLERISFGSNMRGSAEYRRHLCKVLVKRAASEIAKIK